ncbi:MAG: hypothetical protein FRX49_01752 [Trebouxia sp. A1-2]|nr:MAG: hypothetical protein FRX49_01752 [Trebouxia sp. A1-2]
MANIEEALKTAGAEHDLQSILRRLEDKDVGFDRHEAAAGPFASVDTAELSGLNIRMRDKVQLDGKIAVLQRGDVETGQKRLLSLFRRGNEVDLQKNGKSAGRLLLNINALVPGTMPARVEVVGTQEEITQPFLPEDDGNGLSQELFVYDTVIRLSPFQGLHSADDILQGTLANCSAMVQATISNCSAVAKHLRFQVAHGHRD